MFSFISSKASTCAECRSLGSGKSTSKFDKRTIGRPSAYEWPAFQPRPQPRPQPRSQPVVYGPPPTAAQIQVLLYRGREFKELGTELISLRDAQAREELVRGTLVYHA
ncbi:uncharacterized protein TRAVEDRAFT_51506 [Trametes versicolor FP-101664 SS1]|uniref:uncharacterized protein n=1 Tax=Trametes versicolor (strain FP-101664) TaxID=717944 RepID=UPI0004623D1A|nr:uncharacterized protein TRAVEDRAFT_51506 [Trametes versicolor FP-101664 SS1]EIW55384.1 hypothetical protein TRAVEDRAFT_51506 [Trametes versicolor FP-101664 SS1]